MDEMDRKRLEQHGGQFLVDPFPIHQSGRGPRDDSRPARLFLRSQLRPIVLGDEIRAEGLGGELMA